MQSEQMMLPLEGGNPGPECHVEQSRPPITDRLRELSKPVMVQVAPGKWAPRSGRIAPDFTIAQWRPNGDGTFTPVPSEEHMVRLTRKLVSKLVGESIQMTTFYRLARAGYIEIIQPVPQLRLLNLDSWYNHLRRCAENPEIWESGSKWRKAYQQAQGWIDPKTRRNTSGKRERGYRVPLDGNARKGHQDAILAGGASGRPLTRARAEEANRGESRRLIS